MMKQVLFIIALLTSVTLYSQELKVLSFDLNQKDLTARLNPRVDSNSFAQCSLGMMYENGEGIEKDMEQAIKWYKKSATQGFSYAVEALQRLGVE